MIVFDIETGPLCEERLKQLCPDPKPDPKLIDAGKPFDPASVRYGNLKDPVKRAERFQEAQAKHEEGRLKAVEQLKQAAIDHWNEFVSRAALSACTGHLAAIGLCDRRRSPPTKILGVEANSDESEARIIRQFWTLATASMQNGVRLVGHNIFGFDLPFLIRRSWILGIAVPSGVLDKDRYWSPTFVDTMARWRCGNYGDSISLDNLCRALNAGAKPDDCTGAEFARLYYSGNSEDRAKAEKYLVNDLEMTAAAAFRLGIA